MIELLVGPLIGERCSFEAAMADNKDGGPPRGGELIIAIDPTRFGNADDPFIHAERLFEALLEQQGTRLPGDRRISNREQSMREGISIPASLYEKIIQSKDQAP